MNIKQDGEYFVLFLFWKTKGLKEICWGDGQKHTLCISYSFTFSPPLIFAEKIVFVLNLKANTNSNAKSIRIANFGFILAQKLYFGVFFIHELQKNQKSCGSFSVCVKRRTPKPLTH